MKQVRIGDFWVLIIIISFLFQIPWLYWSSYVMAISYLVKNVRLSRVRVSSANEFVFVLAIVFMGRLLSAPQLKDVADALRLVSNGVYCICIYFVVMLYSRKSLENTEKAISILYFSILVSACVYVYSFLFQDQGYFLKSILYPQALATFEMTGLADSIAYSLFWASGLSPYLHLFGYQLAALLGMTWALVFTSKDNQYFYWLIIIVTSAISLVAAQRSVLAAGVVSIFFAIYFARSIFSLSRTVVRVFLFLLIAFGATFVFEDFTLDRVGVDVPSLFDRFDSENVGERGGMQIGALEIISETPFGLIGDWREETYWGVLAKKRGYPVVLDPQTNDYALVHNSYLRFPLQLGWIALLPLMLIISRYFLAVIWMVRAIRTKLADCSPLQPYMFALAISLIGQSVQALFHNDSFLTSEPTSWVSIAILFGAKNLLQSRGKKIS